MSASYGEVGDPGGFPVVFHTGTPCSRLLPAWWDTWARARSLRILCFDRPGYGDAPAEPGRSVSGEVEATGRALAELGVDRFATWGASGGVPYALGCAALLAGQVTAVAVVAGEAPVDRSVNRVSYMDELQAAAASGGRDALIGRFADRASSLRRWDLHTLLAEWSGAFSDPDLAALRDGQTGEYLLGNMQEAVRPGPAGWLDDNLAYVRPWGFDLAAVRAPVSIWHGLDDQMVDVHDSRTFAELLPHAELFEVPGHGHVSLIFHGTEPLLDRLAP